MFGKQKLKDEITRLNYRIADLEEHLCPCESHDWKKVGHYYTSYTNGLDIDAVYKYKCKRCGKLKEETN